MSGTNLIQTVKSHALMSGAVGVLIIGVGLLLIPIALVAAWHFGELSFEAVVLALLLIIVYTNDGGSND